MNLVWQLFLGKTWLKGRFCSLYLVAFLLWNTGCSTFKKVVSPSDSTAGSSATVRSPEIESFRASEPELPEMVVSEFEQIPEDVQPYVQKWLNYFQGKGREHMERYLARSTRYERLMKRILRENGIPEDIIYIALIESGFSPRAISRSRAVGYWQFIRGTGRRYGLAINTFVDERRDPVLATQAAADYFKGLYEEFNSWFLSMASYNVGEGRVRREINRVKSRDFWVIAKRRRLPRETINYVPKFLAARLIAKKPEAYGFVDIPYEPPIEFETVHFDQSVNMKLLADKLNVDYAELKRLNPKYRGEIAPVEGNSLELRLPLNSKDVAIAAAGEVTVKELVFVPDRGETDVYKVRRGDTLLKIAQRFKTSVAFLREINDFKRRSRLRPGRTIFVPIPSVAMPKATAESPMVAKLKAASEEKSTAEKTPAVEKTSVTKNTDEALYLVQEGESLPEIAVKNNMTMEELLELNSFTEGQTVSVGTQLRVKKIQPEAGEPSVDDLPSSTEGVAVAANGSSAVSSEGAGAEQARATEQNKANTNDQKALIAKADVIAKNEAIPMSGDQIDVTKELTHTVKPGDTLIKIALQYNTTVSAIKRVNNLRRRKVLRAGAVLKIPATNEKKNNDSPLKTESKGTNLYPASQNLFGFEALSNPKRPSGRFA